MLASQGLCSMESVSQSAERHSGSAMFI